MSIKMIASDVDGTLIDSSEVIPEVLLEVVKKCREKGIDFCLATGRTYELAQPIIEKLGITSPCVIANGAEIILDGKHIQSHGFCAEPIRELLEEADAEGLTITFSDEYQERAARETDYVRYHKTIGNRFKQLLPLGEIDWKSQQFLKIMIMDENRTGKITKYQHSMKKYEEFYWITTYSDKAVELGPKNCNKASGVRELANMKGIAMKEVMACGDYLNDLEMIEAAGIGVAVGNATEQLKCLADYVAEAPYCYGVIEAIEANC